MKSHRGLYLWLAFFLLVLSGSGWTQSSLTIGPTVSSGTKSFPLNGRFGYVGSLQYSLTLTKQSSIRLYTGYDRFEHNFPGIDPTVIRDSVPILGINGYDISLMPLRTGYQHYLFKDAVFVYAEAELSRLFTRYKDWSIDNSNNLFTYAIGTGYNLAVQQSSLLQLSLSYNYNRLNKYSNRNYLSLRAGYGLTFGKAKK
jgi:hypothetical protein